MFFGQVTIVAGVNDGFTVGAVAGTLTAGSYYIYSPTAADSLLDHLCDQLDAYDPARTWSYSISSTGRVTLTASGSSSLNDLEIYEALGMDEDLGSGTSFAADVYLKYCWFPARDPADSLAPVSRPGRLEAIASQAVAPDGTIYTSKLDELGRQVLTFMYLSKAIAWEGDGDNSSFEEFWSSTLSEGRQLLFLPSYPTATPAHEYKPDLSKGLAQDIKRQLVGSDSYWKAAFALIGV